MKKSLLFAAVLCAFSALSAGAQVHVGLGASIGTDGIGIDAGLTATRWIGVRAGVSFLPSISPKFNVKTYNWVSSSSAGDVKVKGNIKWSEFKLLLDFHPIFGSGFHITAGAFIGNDMPIKANNIAAAFTPLSSCPSATCGLGITLSIFPSSSKRLYGSLWQ